MGHATPDDLVDLAALLDEVRSWGRVVEKGHAVFYVGRLPFLHFHTDRTGGRWADVRDGAAWGPRLDLPRDATAAARRAFLEAVRARHAATLAAISKKKKSR